MANLSIPMTAAQLAGIKLALAAYNTPPGGGQPSGGELTQDQYMTAVFQQQMEQLAQLATVVPTGKFLARFKGGEIKWLFDQIDAANPVAVNFFAQITTGPTVALTDTTLTSSVSSLCAAMEVGGAINVGNAAMRATAILKY